MRSWFCVTISIYLLCFLIGLPATTVTAVNVYGVFNTVLPAIPGMKERGSGQILLMSSVASCIPLPDAPAYGASKSAIRSWGTAMRAKLMRYNVCVNIAAFGFVKSEMTDANIGKFKVRSGKGGVCALAIYIHTHTRARAWLWLSCARAGAFNHCPLSCLPFLEAEAHRSGICIHTPRGYRSDAVHHAAEGSGGAHPVGPHAQHRHDHVPDAVDHPARAPPQGTRVDA